MMRRLAIIGTTMGVLLAASAAHAQGYGLAGCGLGSLVIKDDGKIQILAATTNGTFGIQTFGITSGTSNCTSGGVVKAQREQAAFAEVNFQDLKRNMAAGGGEFLTSFSSLLGCEEPAKPALAKMTQAKYEVILPTEKTTPMELLAVSRRRSRPTRRWRNRAATSAPSRAREGKLHSEGAGRHGHGPRPPRP